jgi:hypothetical protein
MSSKKSNATTLGLLAFVAMFINFVYWIICIINNQGWITIGGRFIDVMLFISTCLLTAVVLIVAYGWAKGQSKVWYIFYWVFAIITILAICVGFGTNLAN